MDVPRKVLSMLEARQQLLGRSWVSAYEYVSEVLRCTESFAEADAIKRSYLRVAKNLRDPAQAGRYRPIDFNILKAVGWEKIVQPNWEEKFKYLERKSANETSGRGRKPG